MTGTLRDPDSIMLPFFAAVLPATGIYCASFKSGRGRFRSSFHTTRAALARAIQEADRDGLETYYAVASYKQGTSREAANVASLQALWLDIDYGDGHAPEVAGYATRDEAIAAVREFCGTANLPPPMLVFSGGGLHVYWPLAEPLAVQNWLPYALGLKALSVTHELRADHRVTADAARILRPPCTTNRKRRGDPRPVEFDPRWLQLKPYVLAGTAFGAALLSASPDGHIRQSVAPLGVLGCKPAYLNGPLAPTLAAKLTMPVDLADAGAVADQCRQLGHMRATRGLMVEPAWRGAIGLLAFCDDGRALAHAWSQGDTRYSRAETDAKWDGVRKQTGPTTCAYFQGLDDVTRGRCAACRHRGLITTPLQAPERAGAPLAPGAEVPATGQELDIAELNSRHFLIKIGFSVVVGELQRDPLGREGAFSYVTKAGFELLYAPRTTVPAGTYKRVPLGPYWLSHPERRQYVGLDIVPGGPRDLADRRLNLWSGWGVEPAPGNWSRMKKHISSILANGDPHAAEYIVRWTAWVLQHPAEQPGVALTIRGGKGSGKGLYFDTLQRMFGRHSLAVASQEHLLGRFNRHLLDSLFVFIDEGFWAGDKKSEGVLKRLITDRTMIVEIKGVDAVEARNRIAFAIATNAEWVVPAGAGERRYAVFETNDKYVKGHNPQATIDAYFEPLYAELEGGGRAAMLYDLLALPLGTWHPRQVYETAALAEQKELSLNQFDAWWLECLEDGRLPGIHPAGQPFRVLPVSCAEAIGGNRFSARGVTMHLQKLGFCLARTAEARYWSAPPLEQARAAWEQKFGARTWRLDNLDGWS